MKRDAVITLLLVIAGMILAIVLFGAGVFWKGRMQPRRPSVWAPAAERDRSIAQEKANSEENMLFPRHRRI